MNVFRVAILCILVLVVALLFYCVFELLPNQQASYNNYQEGKNARKDTTENVETPSAQASAETPAQPQVSASEQAHAKTMEEEEYAVLADARKKMESAQPLKTTDTLIGKVTEVVSPESGGYLILKLDFDTYTLKGESRTVGENTDLYVGCSNGCYMRVTVSPTMDRANKEFLAYVTEGKVEVPAGFDIEAPEPKVGDSVYYWSESHETSR